MNTTQASRIIVALLFAISFTLIGWTAPILYATHAPSEQFIEVHEFTAQNVSPDADSHYVCFDRTAHQSTSGTVYAELYLINDNGDRVEVSVGESMERYFQNGRHAVMTPLTLPQNLAEGKYRYLLVTELHLADGRVERPVEFTSETFYIGEEYSNTTRQDFECG